VSAQYGELRPTSGWDRFTSLGHPSKFQRVSRLVTARHLVVGVSQTLRRWTEGATYVRQGDHHVGHWPTFLVLLLSCAIFIVWQMEKRVGCLPFVPPLKPTRAAYARTYAKTEPVRRRLTTTSLQYCNLTPYRPVYIFGIFCTRTEQNSVGLTIFTATNSVVFVYLESSNPRVGANVVRRVFILWMCVC